MRMINMKIASLFIACSIFSIIYLQSCINNSESNTEERSPLVFSNFDSLEHYSIAIDLYKIGELEDKQNKIEKDNLLLSVLQDSQVDISLLPRLKEIGYSSRSIDKSLYRPIDSLFFSKVRKHYLDTSCIQEFRDILVFYKDKKCIGIAKICFECRAMVSWSQNLKFKGFGDWSDYDVLNPILQKI